MLRRGDAETGQAGRSGIFAQLLHDVKDQGIGVLHLVSSFLRGNFRRHAPDYSMPVRPPPPAEGLTESRLRNTLHITKEVGFIFDRKPLEASMRQIILVLLLVLTFGCVKKDSIRYANLPP